MITTKGTVLLANMRPYKKKDGSQGLIKDMQIMLGTSGALVLQYNNIHESIDINEANKLIGQEVTFEFDIKPDNFNNLAPLLVLQNITSSRTSDSSKRD